MYWAVSIYVRLVCSPSLPLPPRVTPIKPLCSAGREKETSSTSLVVVFPFFLISVMDSCKVMFHECKHIHKKVFATSSLCVRVCASYFSFWSLYCFICFPTSHSPPPPLFRKYASPTQGPPARRRTLQPQSFFRVLRVLRGACPELQVPAPWTTGFSPSSHPPPFSFFILYGSPLCVYSSHIFFSQSASSLSFFPVFSL